MTIGELVEQHRLSAQDLGFAMEKAEDGRLRAAARTMLAYYLRLPQTVETTQRSGPKVVQASRYLQDQEKYSFAEFAFIAGAALAFGLIVLMQFVVEWFKGTFTIPALIAFFAILAYCAWRVYKESKRSLTEYRNYRKGREGEDKVAEKLQTYFDDNWTVFRNVILRGDRKDDLDFVLVGPGGVWVLEVKTYSEGTRILDRHKKGILEHLYLRRPWDEARRAPDQQAGSNAARLKTLLSRRGVDLPWVNAALLFTEYCPVDFTQTAQKTEVWQSAYIDTNMARLGSATAKSNYDIAPVLQELTTIAGKR